MFTIEINNDFNQFIKPKIEMVDTRLEYSTAFSSNNTDFLNKIYLEERIKSFITLPNNWNGDNANPLSSELISSSINFLGQLYLHGILPTSIMPTPESIYFNFKNENYFYSVEQYEDDVSILTKRTTSETDILEYGKENLEDLIKELASKFRCLGALFE